MAQPPAQTPPQLARAASPPRPHSRRNLAGRGGFVGERVYRPVTRTPKELEAGAWSASIVFEFPVNTKAFPELCSNLQKKAAAEGVKLVLRARKSSFGEPKLTVRGAQYDVHIDVLRRWIVPSKSEPRRLPSRPAVISLGDPTRSAMAWRCARSIRFNEANVPGTSP